METQALEVQTSISPPDSAIGTSPDKDSAGNEPVFYLQKLDIDTIGYSCSFVGATSISSGRRRIIKAGDKYEPGWIEKERKNLQAYEYLCRVGEAKQLSSLSKRA